MAVPLVVLLSYMGSFVMNTTQPDNVERLTVIHMMRLGSDTAALFARLAFQGPGANHIVNQSPRSLLQDLFVRCARMSVEIKPPVVS
jgi:hypothetical protein